MNNRNKILFTSAILATLAGCKISGDIPLPKAELPLAFNERAVTDTSGIGAIPWKHFFRDEVLQELIDSTLKKNFDMAIALKNIEQAGQLLRQSKWNNVPSIGLNASVSTSIPSENSLNGLSVSGFLGTGHIEDYSAGPSLSWEADIWGKIRSTNKSALAGFLQRNEARKTLQTDLVSSVSKGYFNLLMLEEQLRAAERNLSLNDSTVHMVTVQYSSGQVSSLAVAQAQAQQLVAAGLVPQLQQEITLQQHALQILSGQLPGIIKPHRTLAETRFPDELPAGIPSAMIRRRPDVRERELALIGANAKVGIARAQMYPALRITASAGLNALKASDWFNIPGSLFGLVGASALQPLLQRRELGTQYQLALIEREKTVILFRQTVLQAVDEVSGALVRIEKLKLQKDAAAKRTATLRQATTNAGLLFKNGMATYLEVITAEANVLQSELELASLRKQELSAVTDLYRSLGGGTDQPEWTIHRNGTPPGKATKIHWIKQNN